MTAPPTLIECLCGVYGLEMEEVRARLSAYRKSKGVDPATATQTQSLHPSILWAQHKDTLLLTVSLNDIQDEKFSLEETTFQFSGVGGSDGKHYNVELEFYKDIVPQKFKHKKTARGLFFEIKKKDQKGPYWPRLISDPNKCSYIHVDFNQWKDEDENDSEDKSKKSNVKPVPQKKEEPPVSPSNPRPWYITALYILLWLLLWGFFISVEFGFVYFLLSAFAFIVLSLRGSRRKIGELSAYSVFNENCETIDGTLTADQFERELRYGPTAVR